MAKIDKIYEAVDDFGLITSTEAEGLGMSNAEMVQQAAKGKLERVARGVYRMPVWPAQQQDAYAIAVKAAGEGACLYGESVIAMLQLAPTDASKMWVASPKRNRRNLGKHIQVIKQTDIVPELVEGIACQPISDAIVSSAKTLGNKRAFDASKKALSEGYITKRETATIEKELQGGKSTE